MTFWNYSGRGRGRGGGSWSAGAGRGGAHATSRGGMSWVRGGGGGNAGGHQNHRGGSASSSSSSAHNKWVRPKEESNVKTEEEEESSSTRARDDSVDEARASTTTIVELSIPPPAPTTTLMVKRGSYQLVVVSRNKKGENSVVNEEESSSKVPAAHYLEDEPKSAKVLQDGNAGNSLNIIMKRVGRNKLVLKAGVKEEGSNGMEAEESGKALQVSPRNSETTDKDDEPGKDEGVALSSTNEKNPEWKGTSKFSGSTGNRKLPSTGTGSKKRPRPSHFHNRRPGAQRIKLTNNHQDPNMDTEVGDQESPQDSEALADTKQGQAHEKLSDFAYHETGRVVQVQQRYQNRTWKAGDNSAGTSATTHTEQSNFEGPRKMGLVRAKQHSNAPICPFYAKGIECTDKFCRKRHDVPKESAVPVCSFFQRNGQCFKDECKFRHIKTRAIVCPTFALLGYCDNDDCTMKHLRPQQKGSTKANGQSTTAGNRRYVRQP